MTWIKTIPYQQAGGALRKLYERIKGPDDNVDNIMLAHSLRPHSMEGHMALYKYVLHHPRNTLKKSYLETIGVYVSLINQCEYCARHHMAGLTRLLRDQSRARKIWQALEAGEPGDVFTGRELAGLEYAHRLTVDSSSCDAGHVEFLRNAGFDDGEILEINQVTAYFAYANRTVLGLGISTDGDVLGLSPGDSDDPENWRHQ